MVYECLRWINRTRPFIVIPKNKHKKLLAARYPPDVVINVRKLSLLYNVFFFILSVFIFIFFIICFFVLHKQKVLESPILLFYLQVPQCFNMTSLGARVQNLCQRVLIHIFFKGGNHCNCYLEVAALSWVKQCPQSGYLSRSTHIRPCWQKPAPQSSNLPLLGQNTAGQKMWPLLPWGKWTAGAVVKMGCLVKELWGFPTGIIELKLLVKLCQWAGINLSSVCF